MRGELEFPLPVLYGFLLVLTRVSSVFVFIPLPGIQSSPAAARIVLSLSLTVALYPFWPAVHPQQQGMGQLVMWMFSEAALGIIVGLLISFITEAVLMGAQVVSIPAGYTYASTIDPVTQADSNVLTIVAQLTAGLLFFAIGLDRQILRVLTLSLETYPPGTFTLTRPMAEQVIQLGSTIFSVGLRLALPLIAFLAMVDVSLALLGRLNSQLQVVTLAFPAKMLLTMGLLAMTTLVLPRLFSETAGQMMARVRSLLSLP